MDCMYESLKDWRWNEMFKLKWFKLPKGLKCTWFPNGGFHFPQSVHASQLESQRQQTPTSQPITLISPKIWFSFEDCWLLQGAKKRETAKGKRRQGRGERLDLFEQSGCNESSLGSLEVDGKRAEKIVGRKEWVGWNPSAGRLLEVIMFKMDPTDLFTLPPLHVECKSRHTPACTLDLMPQPWIPHARHLRCNIPHYHCWHTCLMPKRFSVYYSRSSMNAWLMSCGQWCMWKSKFCNCEFGCLGWKRITYFSVFKIIYESTKIFGIHSKHRSGLEGNSDLCCEQSFMSLILDPVSANPTTS